MSIYDPIITPDCPGLPVVCSGAKSCWLCNRSLDTQTMFSLLHIRHTSLHKKILLLGYSQKSETANVIGQFGEGLKIGALALVREGRLVKMTTSKDVWRFDLSEDEHFEEKVLTVFVSGRFLFEQLK